MCRLRDANINVVVVSIASPNKARQFLDTQRELPADVLYCSQDLEAYKVCATLVSDPQHFFSETAQLRCVAMVDILQKQF